MTEKEFGNEKNKLVITPVGIMALEFLINHFDHLFQYNYTKQMEDDLDQVANGEKIWHEVCKTCYVKLENLSAKILEKGKIGEIYNIGCDEGMEYSILQVAQILIKKLKNTEDYNQWITYIEDRPFNDQRYYISNQKLKELGWTIKIDFAEGLNRLL